MKKRIYENPEVGDRLTFLKTSEETDGKYTLMRVDLSPKGGNPLHYHLSFTEEFRVISGELCISVDGEKHVLKKGQAAAIKPKIRHRFFSETDKPTSFFVEIRPGSPEFERSLAIAYSLAADGRCFPLGIPKNLLHLAFLLESAESYSPGIPLFLQKLFFKTLSAFVKRIGMDKKLERYCG
jgi:quercetin dioxygenase-like cupin family protein